MVAGYTPSWADRSSTGGHSLLWQDPRLLRITTPPIPSDAHRDCRLSCRALPTRGWRPSLSALIPTTLLMDEAGGGNHLAPVADS